MMIHIAHVIDLLIEMSVVNWTTPEPKLYNSIKVNYSVFIKHLTLYIFQEMVYLMDLINEYLNWGRLRIHCYHSNLKSIKVRE